MGPQPTGFMPQQQPQQQPMQQPQYGQPMQPQQTGMYGQPYRQVRSAVNPTTLTLAVLSARKTISCTP